MTGARRIWRIVERSQEVLRIVTWARDRDMSRSTWRIVDRSQEDVENSYRGQEEVESS